MFPRISKWDMMRLLLQITVFGMEYLNCALDFIPLILRPMRCAFSGKVRRFEDLFLDRANKRCQTGHIVLVSTLHIDNRKCQFKMPYIALTMFIDSSISQIYSCVQKENSDS